MGLRPAALNTPWTFDNRAVIPPFSNTPLSIQPTVSDVPLTLVSPNSAAASLKSIRARCAAWPDGLSSALFRVCPYELTNVTADIINRSLSSGCLPDCWRDFAITPISKGVSAETGSMCYIPIANTYILVNLIEKIRLNQVKPILFMYSDPLQFAYKSGSDTRDAVATLSHQILHSLDKSPAPSDAVF